MDARYRKLYPRIWRHRDFLSLGRDDRMLALYILTGPQTNRIGFFAFSPGKAAEDLQLQAGRSIMARLSRVCAAFGWRFDETALVLLVTSWWLWNKPEGANVLVGALKDLSEVPESTLLRTFLDGVAPLCRRLGVKVLDTIASRVAEPLGEGYPHPSTQPSHEGFPQRSPIQEQEQEQEQYPPTPLQGAIGPPRPLTLQARPMTVEAMFGPSDAPEDPEAALIGRVMDLWATAWSLTRNGAVYRPHPVRDYAVFSELAANYGHDLEHLSRMFAAWAAVSAEDLPQWARAKSPRAFLKLAPETDAQLRGCA